MKCNEWKYRNTAALLGVQAGIEIVAINENSLKRNNEKKNVDIERRINIIVNDSAQIGGLSASDAAMRRAREAASARGLISNGSYIA
jgi:hypothetical protein